MARRPHPGLADYLVIAITPAMIMFLVGSLVFFLVEVFYQGQYNFRLQFIMAMFVMAAVCIGRISIEDGREYAMAFALPLAIVTAIALWRFVEFQGFLANFSVFINLGLIGLIWWCADRLTWDCTVIDEQKDASGEGLLQTVGLEGGDEADGEISDPEATTGGDAPEPALSLWQRFLDHRRRPHAPGVWVIYFSIAALPIFGIGQWFVQAGDLSSRRWIFNLLVIYVASALGLLLTTSFLGLRRYLRQRRLEMPDTMAGVWMGVGAVMIVALLLVCLAMPRRNSEYSITHLPIFAGAPKDLQTNRYGFGNDGPEEDEAERTVQREDAERQSSSGDRDGGKQKGGSQSGGSKSKSGKQSKAGGSKSGKTGEPSKGGQSKQGQKSSSQDKQSGNQSQDSRQDSGNDRQDQQSGEQNQDRSSQQSDASDAEERGGRDRDDRSKADQQQSENQKQSGNQNRKSENSSNSQSRPSNRSFSPQRVISNIGWGIGNLFKLIYWIVVIAIVGFLLWKYWEQISKAVRNFVQAMQEFWARLFGRDQEVVEEEDLEEESGVPPPRPFSDFSDPFVSGMSERVPVDELIRYSFEAFEAWARERGAERAAEQTPHEFALAVSRKERALGKDALRLAELYAWSAFGKTAVPASSAEHIRKFWQKITAVPV